MQEAKKRKFRKQAEGEKHDLIGRQKYGEKRNSLQGHKKWEKGD